MKANTSVSVVITLELTREEARWLHGYMRNPQNVDCPTLEHRDDTAMRQKFFDATQTASEITPGDLFPDED